MKCEDCRHTPNTQGCIEAFDCDCEPSSWTVDSIVLCGFIGQAMWEEDGATWFDATTMHDTADDAAEQLALCASHFEDRKHLASCVRKGIRATRIVHRTITDTPAAPNAPRQDRSEYAPPSGLVDWSADSWFAKHHTADLPDEFKTWWLDYYGFPDDYDGAEDEQHEYWTRCAFALRGWLASRAPNAGAHTRSEAE